MLPDMPDLHHLDSAPTDFATRLSSTVDSEPLDIDIIIDEVSRNGDVQAAAGMDRDNILSALQSDWSVETALLQENGKLSTMDPTGCSLT
jgi:hypothetical protein